MDGRMGKACILPSIFIANELVIIGIDCACEVFSDSFFSLERQSITIEWMQALSACIPLTRDRVL